MKNNMKFEIKSDHGSIEIDSNVPILTDNVKINHIQVVKVHGYQPEDDYEKVIINIIEPKDLRIEQVKVKDSKFEFTRIIPIQESG
jgi:hypothetical protein